MQADINKDSHLDNSLDASLFVPKVTSNKEFQLLCLHFKTVKERFHMKNLVK